MKLVKPDWDYYSQRNNEIDHLISCNVTDMIQALDILCYLFPNGEHKQPEDNLRAFLKRKGINPENHYDLSKGVNIWMERAVTHFHTTISVKELKYNIDEGRPVVLSGTFPGYPTKRP